MSSILPCCIMYSQVLLVLVNVDQRFMLRELNLFCYRTGWTLVLCYSPEEAAEYLENFHMAKNKNEQSAVTAMQEKKKKRQGISETNESCQVIFYIYLTLFCTPRIWMNIFGIYSLPGHFREAYWPLMMSDSVIYSDPVCVFWYFRFCRLYDW